MLAISLDKFHKIESLIYCAIENFNFSGPVDLHDYKNWKKLCHSIMNNEFPEIAAILDIPSEELKTFCFLDNYCYEIAFSDGNFLPDNLPSPETLAEELGIPNEQFLKWATERVRKYKAPSPVSFQGYNI